MNKKEFNAKHSSTGSTLTYARESLQWRSRTSLRICVTGWSCWPCWRSSLERGCPWSEAVSSDGLTTSVTSTRRWSFCVASGWVSRECWSVIVVRSLETGWMDGTGDCFDLSPTEWHQLPSIRNTLLLLCSSFLSDILSLQIKLVNINASDVVDGKSAVVLGLIWTIILYFQVIIRRLPVISYKPLSPIELKKLIFSVKSFAAMIYWW